VLSVRAFLVLLVVAVMLPLVTLTALLTFRAVEAETVRATQTVAATAYGALTALEREIAGLAETLQTLEISPSLTAGDLPAFHQQITTLTRIFGIGVTLRDPEGRIIASSRAPLAPPAPDQFDLPPAPDAALLRDRGVVITGLYEGPMTRNAVFALMMPVRREGAVRYLLHLAPMATRLRDLLAAINLPDGLRVAVLDPQGLVIARSHGHAEAVGRPSALRAAMAIQAAATPHTGRGIDQEGQEVHFHAHRTTYGWTVVTSMPAEQIDGPRRRALVSTSLACIALVGAALVAARVLGNRLAGAIGRLAVAGSALDRDEAAPIAASGIREIDDVARTLTQAGERLRGAAAQRAEAEERQRLILHELNHRVKNTLAMVQAMAALAARGTPDVAAYRDRLTERLNGLARTQALLTESDWTGAQLEELLRTELAPYDEVARGGPDSAPVARIAIAGPPVRLPAHQVVPFGMLVHELGTNAAKYGALSLPQGRLAIGWTVTQGRGAPVLAMSWTESGGPPVVQPMRQGFGTQMIGRGLARQLGARVATEWRPEGVHFTLEMPLGGQGGAA
jgi:two-component sensor histidine kinase